MPNFEALNTSVKDFQNLLEKTKKLKEADFFTITIKYSNDGNNRYSVQRNTSKNKWYIDENYYTKKEAVKWYKNLKKTVVAKTPEEPLR